MSVYYTKSQMDEIAGIIGDRLASANATVINNNTGLPVSMWIGSQLEYDSLDIFRDDILYVVTE